LADPVSDGVLLLLELLAELRFVRAGQEERLDVHLVGLARELAISGLRPRARVTRSSEVDEEERAVTRHVTLQELLSSEHFVGVDRWVLSAGRRAGEVLREGGCVLEGVRTSSGARSVRCEVAGRALSPIPRVEAQTHGGARGERCHAALPVPLDVDAEVWMEGPELSAEAIDRLHPRSSVEANDTLKPREALNERGKRSLCGPRDPRAWVGLTYRVVERERADHIAQMRETHQEDSLR
jgi:hypothetical protein